MIMRMMMFTMRMGPYYSNTFKLREMYYQYSHVVENNAQHKWRAEQSPPRASIGNLKQFTSICITFTLLDKQKEVYWQNPENLFFRGGHFWRAKSKKIAKTFQKFLLFQNIC